MNLRTLKKLSKRASELLPLLGDRSEQFPSRRGDNYHGCFISARKHWDRSRCHASYVARNEYRPIRAGEIVYVTRAGNHVVIRPPWHPRKGTMMVGGMDGGPQAEWYEQSCWDYLDMMVRAHFTDWDRMDDENLTFGGALTRDLSSPRLVFAAANDIIRERRMKP